MVITVKHRILISCPGDVASYFMQDIIAAVESYNQKLNFFLPVFEESFGYIPCFETLYYTEDASPVLAYGKSAQDILDNQLVDKVDATIAFFYTRLGTKTDTYPSGTVEEIEKTNQRNCPVSIIHINTPSIPSELLGDGRQYKLLQEYLDSFSNEKKGYVATIQSEKIQATLERILKS